MSRFVFRANLCVGKISIDSSIQAQRAGEFMRQKRRTYGLFGKVLWLWLAIDPCTKLMPVLHLGPRTQNMAYRVIHSLRQLLAPGCLPLFTSDGLNLYFYASRGPFWTVA